MPQLFWLVVVFALIYFGIGRAMLPKIERTIEDRDAKIKGDLAAAESARAEADSADDAYQAKLAATRGEAQAAAAKAKTEAALAAEKRVKKADAEIAAKVEQAEAALGRNVTRRLPVSRRSQSRPRRRSSPRFPASMSTSVPPPRRSRPRSARKD